MLLDGQSAGNIISACNSAFSALGTPTIMQGDNAQEFVHGLDTHLWKLDIEPRHGRTYHPEAQGVIERANG